MRFVNSNIYWKIRSVHRKNRARLFREFVMDMPRPVRILDIGGTQAFWITSELAVEEEIHVTLLNIEPQSVSLPNFQAITADGTGADFLGDREFDVVFSNSAIEHCGDYGKQRTMAYEIQRLGHRYWVQTPNYWFPIEPHFLFPCFHWFPVLLRAVLIRFVSLGWYNKRTNFRDAFEAADSVHLLSARHLRTLFPKGILLRERVFGFTKSLIICSGFPDDQKT